MRSLLKLVVTESRAVFAAAQALFGRVSRAPFTVAHFVDRHGTPVRGGSYRVTGPETRGRSREGRV
jgi:hypothetical protein